MGQATYVSDHRELVENNGKEAADEPQDPSMIDWSQIWKPLALIVGTFWLCSGFRWETSDSHPR